MTIDAGLLSYSEVELEIARKEFEEKAFLLGTNVRFFEIDSYTVEFDHDRERTFKTPVEIRILWEDGPPAQQTLKRVGWYQENPEDLPLVAHLPFWHPDDPIPDPPAHGPRTNPLDIQIGSIVEFETEVGVIEKTKRWQVRKIVAHGPHQPIHWTIALAPARETFDNKSTPPAEPADGDFDFLNVPEDKYCP